MINLNKTEKEKSMRNDKSIKKNLSYQIVYRILTVITPLITSPYLSRTLGAQKLGVFSATYAYANYFILIAMLGVEYYGNRSIAICSSKKEIKNRFWEIYRVQLGASIVAVFIYYISILGMSNERKIYAICQGIWIIAAALDINWFFFGTQQFKLTVTRNILIKIFTIACIFLFVKKADDLTKYILVMAGGMLINQLIMWFFLLKQIGIERVSIECIMPHVRPMVKLFIPVVGLSIFQIMDKTMVDWFSDEINSGCYYNADRLMNIPLGVITAMSTVMLPRLAKEFHRNSEDTARQLLTKSAELTISLACAVSFGIGAISYEFVPFFFGEEFILCTVLILGLMPAIIIKSLEEYIRSQYLIPTGRDNTYITAVFIAAGVNVVANYILIPRFGALGAVIGTDIAEIVLLFVQATAVRKQIGFGHIFIKNGFYICLGCVMFGGIRFFSNATDLTNSITVLVSVILGGCIYVIGTLVYASLNKKSIYHIYVDKGIEIIRRR